MKKHLFLLVTACLLLVGCQEQGTSSSSASQGEQYYGQVTEAYGNDVTLLVGTLQESAGNARPSREDAATDDASSSDEERGTPPTEAEGEAPTGQGGGDRPSDMAGGEMGGAPSGGTGNQGGASQMGIQLDLTGEEKSIRIPVGVPITRVLGEQERTTTFTQISAENILRITTLQVDGQETITKVEILR